MKRLLQGFIAGVAFTSAITGIALSQRNSITAVKSRVKKGAEDLKEKAGEMKEKAKRTIKVEGETNEQQAEGSPTVTPEYSGSERTDQPDEMSSRKRPEVKGYRKQSPN